MPDLSFRAWVPDETYGGYYWSPMKHLCQENFVIGVCEKNFFFSEHPQKNFDVFSGVPFFRV
jgi:hypothetical protein